jgi:P27 family predicted phage terminase small subunit
MPKLRIPTQTKIIRGTFRKDRTAANEPRPERVVEVSRPPSYLSKYAKKLWKKLAGELVEKGILTVLDLPALEVCCEAYGQFREAQEIVFKVIVDPETRKRCRQTLTEYMKGRSSHSAPEYTLQDRNWISRRLDQRQKILWRDFGTNRNCCIYECFIYFPLELSTSIIKLLSEIVRNLVRTD